MYHELYGKYYQIIHNLLNEGPKTEQEIEDYIRKYGFEESFLYLNADMLVNSYHLFEKKGDLYYPVVKHKLPKVYTREQIAWVRLMLNDDKTRFFLSNEKINEYKVKFRSRPLYDVSKYLYQYQDKDKDEAEGKNIYVYHRIINAIRDNLNMQIVYVTNRDHFTKKIVAPYKFEYSMQDQKIRLLAIEYNKKGKPIRLIHIRLSSIKHIDYVDREEAVDFEHFLNMELLAEPLILEVYPELNGIERVFIELSNYKRESVFDKEKQCAIMKVYYEKSDELDLVIKMLSFGKIVKIISDGFIKDEVLRRLNMQRKLFKMRNVKKESE